MDHKQTELWITEWVRQHGTSRDKLLPLLHDLQGLAGYIDDALVHAIAGALNISRADVHGVITFYHDFRRSPPGRHVVKFCRAESCQARGGSALETILSERLGVSMDETSRDGLVSLETVYCLGLCATGPNAMIDGRPISRLDKNRIEQIAIEVAA